MSSLSTSRAEPWPRPDAAPQLVLVVSADDVPILYWAACGHALADDEVLYDRLVCLICDELHRDDEMVDSAGSPAGEW